MSARAKSADNGNLPAPGRKAPKFTLKDQHGTSHTLSDYAGKWVVLYFYPKDDTPGCTKEACQFRDASPHYEGLNAVVFGVSADNEASHARFATKYELPFSLLADPDHAALEAYGVWQEKSMYGRTYMGVARTTFLIDPEGRIAQVWPKVRVDGHEAEVRACIESMRR